MLLLCVTALIVGTRRQRVVLAVVMVGVVSIVWGLNALLTAGSGFGAQARHLLPITVMLALLAGHIVTVNRHRLGPRSVSVATPAIAALVAACQFGGWYDNSRRYAVGTSGRAVVLLESAMVAAAGLVPVAGTSLIIVVALMVASGFRTRLLAAAPADAGLDEVVDVAV